MKSFRLIGIYIKHNVMSAMAYREAFFLQAFGMLINDLMLLVFWVVLFSRFPNIKGWDLQDVVTLYAIVASGFGLAEMVFGNTGQLARMISAGDLDYYLALPADPLVHLLVSRTSLSAWGDLLFGCGVFLIADAEHMLLLPLFLCLSVLSSVVFVSFGVGIGSLAFWLGQAQNLAMQFRNALVTFGLYPVDIFPGMIRLLLYTLIPAAFVGSLPARLLVSFTWWQFFSLIGFTCITMFCARWLFYRGLRRYTSGNLVTIRG